MQTDNVPIRHFNKTRLAPTPSGFLHLGNVLSFSVTALLARRHGAKILLRIDDLDHERARPEYVQDIFDTLNFLEIPWHEGPGNPQEFAETFSQHKRMHLYRETLDELRKRDLVFACNCSRSDILRANAHGIYPGTCLHKNLPLDSPETAWRLKNITGSPITVKGLYNTTHHELPSAQQYCVVRKKDGYPAYQLTSVVDDMHFGIDLIVRGADLWPSTLAQLRLAELAGLGAFADVTFHHHALITGENGEKLSKSAGATSIQYLRREGKTKEEIYTMLGSSFGFAQEDPVSAPDS